METYLFKFTSGPQGGAIVIPATGDLFVYESADGDPNNERRVRVRPTGGGGEVVLRPGQQFRTSSKVTGWNVRSYTGAETLNGAFIIGEGHFADSNTKNTLSLDAAFANNVTVMNDNGQRVPVSLDTAQILPVFMMNEVEVKNDSGNPLTVAIDSNTQDNIGGLIVNYTHAYASNAAGNANTPIQLLAAGTNQNGAALVKFDMITGAVSVAGMFAVIAKATAPASVLDGDVLLLGNLPAGSSTISMDLGKVGAAKALPGKAIWYITSTNDYVQARAALLKAA